MILCVKKLPSLFQGQEHVHQKFSNIHQYFVWNFSWTLNFTTCPYIGFRYHHRAGSRILQLPLVPFVRTKQLTTAQDEKGYKIKTSHVSKTAWSWFLAWKTVSSESIKPLFLPNICDKFTSQQEQGGSFALISLSDFPPKNNRLLNVKNN